ncbi:MAG: hypothetical protein DMG67_03480 [Acidobacteria bacterium]|nr:MAG: hypothetical protein DMG67_03480 [Acidobacteriota bacterium]
MGWGVAWNVTTPFLVVQMPPGSANWCIGCIGSEESATEAGTGKAIPNGFYDSLGALVTPSSLYLAQLRDRLGNAAIANIGYGNFALAATPSSRTVTAGGSTSYTISVTPSGTFSDSVVLSVSGLPMGASASLTPASLASGNSTLSISTSSSTPAGSYTLSVTGTSGNLAHSKNVTLNVNPSATLPAGWSDTDIGTVGVAGSASFSNGVFTVNGSGSDIWSSADSFNYASESLSGDVTITARVASQQNTNAWAKSGVMIRETTAANSSYVFVFVTPSMGREPARCNWRSKQVM